MDARAAMRDIVHLAEDIGPREATSRNFAEAAAFVETRFERLGYQVRRTKVRVPAGNSWGTPVRRGTSVNVIAEPKGFDATEPYVVVGDRGPCTSQSFDFGHRVHGPRTERVALGFSERMAAADRQHAHSRIHSASRDETEHVCAASHRTQHLSCPPVPGGENSHPATRLPDR
jgi:hypothetical protein